MLPALGVAEDGLLALRAMLEGAPPQLLAAVLEPGVCDPPGDGESQRWLATRRKCGWCYDLLLLDVQMPGKNGDEVVAQLRRLGARMPIIAATGTSEPDALERLRACDFTPVRAPRRGRRRAQMHKRCGSSRS